MYIAHLTELANQKCSHRGSSKERKCLRQREEMKGKPVKICLRMEGMRSFQISLSFSSGGSRIFKLNRLADNQEERSEKAKKLSDAQERVSWKENNGLGVIHVYRNSCQVFGK